jgi:hypothetical protein
MNSSLIDVVIGLVVVYFVFSTTCTVVTEWWSRLNSARPRQLQTYVGELVGDKDWAEKVLYRHPLIDSLRTERLHLGSGSVERCLPSYIPAKVFALALIDLAFREEEHHMALNDDIPERLKTTLHALTNCTRNSCQHTQERIERWFTDSMARLTGRYTRYAQTVSLTAAAFITLAFNVDTVWLARTFAVLPAKTQAAVALASKISFQPNQAAGAMDSLAPAFQKLDLPLGWPDGARKQDSLTTYYALGKIVGWLLTISALSLGAPFWFDTLNRLMRLRQAGVSPGAP